MATREALRPSHALDVGHPRGTRRLAQALTSTSAALPTKQGRRKNSHRAMNANSHRAMNAIGTRDRNRTDWTETGLTGHTICAETGLTRGLEGNPGVTTVEGCATVTKSNPEPHRVHRVVHLAGFERLVVLRVGRHAPPKHLLQFAKCTVECGLGGRSGTSEIGRGCATAGRGEAARRRVGRVGGCWPYNGEQREGEAVTARENRARNEQKPVFGVGISAHGGGEGQNG